MLTCLDALVTEAHVSRAASRMGMGQPAMSAMLARLRRAFDDPLLVRTAQGMTATPEALRAAERARQALQIIGSVFSERERFEPGNSTVNFRIVAFSSLSFSLLPKLVRHLGARAPGMRILMQPADVRKTRELLETNQCDMVIGYPPSISTGLHAQTLFRLPLVCIARAGHPSIRGRVALEDYVSIPHVVLGGGPDPVSTIEANVERALRRRRRERQIGVRAPDLLVSAAVVAGTDMIATISERVAREFAAMLRLQVLKLPIVVPEPNIFMIWHERAHRDSAHRYLRQAVRDVTKGFDPTKSTPNSAQ